MVASQTKGTRSEVIIAPAARWMDLFLMSNGSSESMPALLFLSRVLDSINEA